MIGVYPGSGRAAAIDPGGDLHPILDLNLFASDAAIARWWYGRAGAAFTSGNSMERRDSNPHDQGSRDSAFRFLPSKVNDAYPLNASSVVVALDGCMFTTPNALAALLTMTGGQDYVEITYYQANEAGRPLRRAFLPIYPRSAVDTEWTQLTRSS
ncbi:MAG: hypothetical protein QM676_02940 [Novosphingobium sp.]